MKQTGCAFEVVLYDAKRWWNIFDIFNPLPHQGVAIRFDKDHYVTWDNRKIHKVKVNKIKKYITWRDRKEVSCRQALIGRIWLQSCLDNHHEFNNGKEFLSRYVSIMQGVNSGK